MSPWEARGDASAGTPSISTTLPRPKARRFGTSRPPTALAVLTRVLAPSSPKSAASGASPAPTPSRTTTTALRPIILLVSSRRASRRSRRSAGSLSSGDERPDAELGDLAPATRRHPADAAEQDGYGAEVGEPGEREGDDGDALLGELVDARAEVRVGDEFVEDDLLPDEVAGIEHLVPRHPDGEGHRREDVAQD